MQERHNSTANALELRLSCTNPSRWSGRDTDTLRFTGFVSVMWEFFNLQSAIFWYLFAGWNELNPGLGLELSQFWAAGHCPWYLWSVFGLLVDRHCPEIVPLLEPKVWFNRNRSHHQHGDFQFNPLSLRQNGREFQKMHSYASFTMIFLYCDLKNKFHWRLCPSFQLTTSQHWFR